MSDTVAVLILREAAIAMQGGGITDALYDRWAALDSQLTAAVVFLCDPLFGDTARRGDTLQQIKGWYEGRDRVLNALNDLMAVIEGGD